MSLSADFGYTVHSFVDRALGLRWDNGLYFGQFWDLLGKCHPVLGDALLD
jgi:hypothetical protein